MKSDEGWSSKDEVVISDMTPLILRVSDTAPKSAQALNEYFSILL